MITYHLCNKLVLGTIFTNGSSNGHAACAVADQLFSFPTLYSSAQLVELYAVILVLQTFDSVPLNIYTDSICVVQSLPPLETSAALVPITTAFFL